MFQQSYFLHHSQLKEEPTKEHIFLKKQSKETTSLLEHFQGIRYEKMSTKLSFYFRATATVLISPYYHQMRLCRAQSISFSNPTLYIIKHLRALIKNNF